MKTSKAKSREPRAESLPKPDRKRAALRWWFTTDDGQLVRGLTWENYEQCCYRGTYGPRTYTMILRPDDPRPIGRRTFYGKHWDKVSDAAYVRSFARHYRENYIVGVWYNETSEPIREVPPYRDCTALWLVKGAAA